MINVLTIDWERKKVSKKQLFLIKLYFWLGSEVHLAINEISWLKPPF